MSADPMTWHEREWLLFRIAWAIAVEEGIGLEAAQAVPLGVAQQLCTGIARRTGEDEAAASAASNPREDRDEQGNG